MSFTAENNENDEMSLKEIILSLKFWLNYLKSKWILIFGFSFMGLLFGIGYAIYIKKTYISSTSFVLEGSNKGSAGLAGIGGLASMAGIDIGGAGGGLFQGDNIMELYKSRSMIEKTLLTEVEINNKKIQLIEIYIQNSKLKDKWENIPGIENVNFKSTSSSFRRLQDSLVGSIVQEIKAKVLFVYKPDKKLNIIKVDVKSKNENFSKYFNDKIVENVNDFYIQTKTKKETENLAGLVKQTDSVRRELYGDIYNANVSSDATPNLNPTRQVVRSSSQRSQFNAEANKLVYSTLLQNLELARLSVRNETPLIQVIDKPVFPLEVERVGKVKSGIIGASLFAFLTLLYLILNKNYKTIISEQS